MDNQYSNVNDQGEQNMQNTQTAQTGDANAAFAAGATEPQYAPENIGAHGPDSETISAPSTEAQAQAAPGAVQPVAAAGAAANGPADNSGGAQAQSPVSAQAQIPVGAQAQIPVGAQAQTPFGAQAQSPVDAQAQSAGVPHVQTREEWERLQREIQDREWRERQMTYSKQLADNRASYYAGARDYADGFVRRPDGQPGPYADYAQQYAGSAGESGAPYGPQYSYQRPADGYQQPQANVNQPYRDNQYYYDPRQAQQQPRQQAQEPVLTRKERRQSKKRQSQQYSQNQAPWPQSPSRQEDRRSKRKTVIQIIAAALAGALIATAVFTTGYYIGNGSMFGLRTMQDNQSPAAGVATSGEQPQRGDSQSGNTGGLFPNQGGFGGYQQDRPSLLPPSGRQNDRNQGDDAEQQPDQNQPQQQEQQQQQVQPEQPQLQASSGAGEIPSLKLNPPNGVELSVPDIYQKVYPSIVGVRITFASQGYRFGGIIMPGQEESGEGSGIIIRDDGYIMTNHHVIKNVVDSNTRLQIEGTKIEVFLPDDSATAYPAKIIGYDSSTDLCVLKIDKTNLKEAELGDADKLVVGEFVVAIGNPGGMEYMSSITFGVISGLNRSIQTEGYRNIQLIQTDAAINPGNSGGALINRNGQVIGVNSIKIADSAYEGLGFAIPINAAVRICDDLMNYTYVTGRPYIGITAYSQYTEQLADQYKMPKGVYVYEVDETGPSQSIINKNDIIVKFNAVTITNFDSLETEKNKCKPGDRVTMQVYRDWSTNDYTSGKYVDIEIVLGEKRN